MTKVTYMWIDKCSREGCNAEVDRDATILGWTRDRQAAGRKMLCPIHSDLGSLLDSQQTDDETDLLDSADDEFYGFIGPEPGSEQRYVQRLAERPWVAHTFWWFVHNCIAHPLIGIMPCRLTFDFHDWSSERMHNRPAANDTLPR